MGEIRFGAAVRDITPHHPVLLHGYSGRSRKSGTDAPDTVSEPLYLGALALNDGRQTVVFVTLDMIGVRGQVARQLLQVIEKSTGLGFPNIVLTASHTHFAPALHPDTFASPEIGIAEPDERFVHTVRHHAIQAVQESLSNMQTGKLEVYRAHVPSVLFNRRTVTNDGNVVTNFLYPENPAEYAFSPVDDELTALRIRTPSGIAAVLLNFGCHPVTGGRDREVSLHQISSDYPYYARRFLSSRYGCPVYFTLGAAGDAVPMNRQGQCRAQIGAVLANSVLLGERIFAESDECVLETAVKSLRVATIMPTAGVADLYSQYEQSKSKLFELQHDESIDPASDEYQHALVDYRDKSTRCLRHRLYPDDTYTIDVQFVCLGGQVMVALPFEVLAEFAIRMKKRFPDSILLSTSNGYEGYLPFAREYERGGYEASTQSTHFTIGTAEKLFDLVADQLQGF